MLTTEVPNAGPSIIFSFIAAAAVVGGLTALCYAELASSIPVSGSSYSYAYATLGEGTAMVVAACLLLEYGASCAAVAVGWSEYVARVDGEYEQHLGAMARDALQDAEMFLGGDTKAEYIVRTGRSVPTTLAKEAASRGARMLVLGSSSHGSWGHVALLGSTGTKILQNFPVPVILMPAGTGKAAVSD